MEGLFAGRWYRSAVKLEGDKIVPVPPFEAYNPFDWYYSASEVRQGDRSLYLEFLGVDAEKPEEILKFCQRFGVLGSPSSVLQSTFFKLKQGRIKSEPWPENPNPGSTLSTEDYKEYFYSLRFSGMDQTKFSANELCCPMLISHFQAFKKDIKSIFSPPFPPPPRFAKLSHAEYKISLPIHRIHSGIVDHRVRPTIGWNIQKAQWEFVWTSMSLSGYFYIMAMLDLLGPGKTLSCPRCHKFFVTASNRMKFCSPSCYGVFKVQKYQREKKERELAAQKGKKNKATKSTPRKK